jgi:hypothetical protein
MNFNGKGRRSKYKYVRESYWDTKIRKILTAGKWPYRGNQCEQVWIKNGISGICAVDE